MFDLNGRTALVTGASGGIGGDIARALHAQGAAVILSGTRAAALDALAGELGANAHVIVADLGDGDSIENLAKQAEAAVDGGVDILVNNAGITRDGLILRMKDEDWDDVLRVNLTSGFRLSRALIRPMMKRRWGRIISISSIVGATGNAGQVNYAAAKAGMVGFSKSLAQEVASRGITVNVVAPGFIATAMTEALADDQKSQLLGAIPMGRMGAGADIAGAVGFLASEAASYVTGETLHVNGGMAML
ncbi:MAG: 3-oxoacyl-[acyl-carrier-protein] reductase [Pseudomonadota bacterium]|nr:3-oxoacyl-[acyl-carrier-protein] reductase [Pseudomonadota bacterium]